MHFPPDIAAMFMRRAAQLALCGRGAVSPNPLVGAVVVSPEGRVIGEGFHRAYGGPHAEVNAIASVASEQELRSSTLFVTLEPCSHYGKTPPCAELIIRSGIPRVVVGSPDPFPQVSGRGIAMLRRAGVEVVENFMRDLTDSLNPVFLTAHTLGRPYILLKWACSADGFMAAGTPSHPRPLRLSSPLTAALMHRIRSEVDAVMVGTRTANIDNPRLDVRLWPGRSPRPVTFDLHGRLDRSGHLACNGRSIILGEDLPLPEQMRRLYTEHGVTSVMVEGGPALLVSFIGEGLWDAARIETSPVVCGTGVAAPPLPDDSQVTSRLEVGGHAILHVTRRGARPWNPLIS